MPFQRSIYNTKLIQNNDLNIKIVSRGTHFLKGVLLHIAERRRYERECSLIYYDELMIL